MPDEQKFCFYDTGLKGMKILSKSSARHNFIPWGSDLALWFSYSRTLIRWIKDTSQKEQFCSEGKLSQVLPKLGHRVSFLRYRIEWFTAWKSRLVSLDYLYQRRKNIIPHYYSTTETCLPMHPLFSHMKWDLC